MEEISGLGGCAYHLIEGITLNGRGGMGTPVNVEESEYIASH